MAALASWGKAMLTKARIIEIAARAATIDERLDSGFVAASVDAASDARAAADRLAAWRRAAAAGDEAAFVRRLARDGLSLDAVMARLGDRSWTPESRLPAWCDVAEWMVQALLQQATDARDEPFSGLFAGVVATAELRRNARLGPTALAGLSGVALSCLAGDLRQRLSHLARLPLFNRLAMVREERACAGLIEGTYRAFADELRRGGWADLFEELPVLLRLMAVTVGQWIDTTAEMMERLAADRALLPAAIGGDDLSAVVVDVADGLADLHKCGRSVQVLTFGDGRAVVYKPKSLGIDAAVKALLSWLAARGAPMALRVPRVVDRGDYGWAEVIAPGAVADEAAAGRFFHSAGGWTALLYALAATDMHEENVIAAGEALVPIDIETCLLATTPRASDAVPALAARARIEARLMDSVVTTGMLPIASSEGAEAITVSGGLAVATTTGGFEFGWLDVGTDTMRPVEVAVPARALFNLPMLDGKPVVLRDHMAAFEAGLRTYLGFLAELKEELLAEDGPLATFESAVVRRVVRPTRFYGHLLRRASDYRSMDDGARWSAALDFVSRVSEGDSATVPWPLVAAERQALAALNVPYFAHGADGQGMTDGLVPIGGVQYPSGLDEVRRRLAKLDSLEVERQIEMMRLSQLGVGCRRRPADAEDFGPPAGKGELASLSSAVDAIADRVSDAAIETEASAAWMGLAPLSDGNGWAFYRLGDDLYSGTGGLALFLAAHANARGSQRSRTLALKAVAGIVHLISSDGSRLVRVMGIGAGAGLGGVVYALATLARLLDAPGLLSPALRAASLIDADALAADTSLDVMDGAAGAALGLLRLYRATGLPEVLDRARACGGHLLMHAGVTGSGGVYLPRREGGPGLAGMSHGASGAGLALARLAIATGEHRFTAGAERFLAYERSLFDAARGNWPDLREQERSGAPAWLTQWCHGAVGIGLVRAALIEMGWGGETVRDELVTAAGTVAAASRFPDDTLCCGSMGSIAFLQQAGRLLGRSDWEAEATRRMAARRLAAVRTGTFAWSAGGDRENVGLFLGLTGVGYVALRELAGGAVPDVLTLA